MKKLLFSMATLAFLGATLQSWAQIPPVRFADLYAPRPAWMRAPAPLPSENKAVFDYFEYTGNDERFNVNYNPAKEYLNPIVAGFWPYPSICRKGDDYYMVNSTFGYFPGVPIFHSKDLVNWTPLGHVLNRPSQLELGGLRHSRGIYAPAIEYNPHNDTFYMITTSTDGAWNFVVKTKDPHQGNWSDPILLPEVFDIDPSFFFDDDGKAYIVHRTDPPVLKFPNHKMIVLREYDTEKDETVGDMIILIEESLEWLPQPQYIEGPHIYKINGKYHLIAAEGGTWEQHAEVALTADNIKGPYRSNPINPILTQRTLPENRPEKVTTTGHLDFLQDHNGEWWGVFLACRPYEEDYYNTGRETFLLPVKWVDSYPVVIYDEPVPTVVKKKNLQPGTGYPYLTGNFTWRDEFDRSTLDFEWSFIRTPRGEWWQQKNGQMIIDALPRSVYDLDNPAYIGKRQQHQVFEAETQFSFVPTSDKELAGMVYFQNEKFNFVFGKTLENGKMVITLDRAEGENKRIASVAVPAGNEQSPLKMKISVDKGKGSFFVAYDGGPWQPVAQNVDVKNLSTHSAGGFVGATIGMYVTSAKVIPALKDVYADYFDIGVEINQGNFIGHSASMLAKHFNSITAENDMKMGALLRPDFTVDFERADRYITVARRNGQKVRGHTLVWHNNTPRWFYLDENGNQVDSATLYRRMEAYMEAVIPHFKDDVYCWDVVNEAISDREGEHYRTHNSPWFQICGKDFIARAFRTAHRIDPQMKLVYNDYHLTDPVKRMKTYEMLKEMIEDGVPIHVVGMQGHWSMDETTVEDIQASIDLFSSLGLEVHITELDLTMYTNFHGEGEKNQTQWTRQYNRAAEQEQAQFYRDFFECLRANKGKVTSVTFWGLSDGHTWLHNFPVRGRGDYPLLFDREYEPKEAFWRVVEF